MFQIRSWPNVILHLDGDAFFASVIQAVNPYLRGKPVVTGKERGIATAISYEAKKYGIKRGMRFFEIKKVCPSCIFIDSDYEIYDLFSRKMFEILRLFSPAVEEYSIDEGFADIKGLRRPLNMSYFEIGKNIKEKIEASLGITVSVGISLTKSLAKIASSFQKPSGLTIIDGRLIEKFLIQIPIEKIWGIGENTSSYLKKFGINNALEFTLRSEAFIKKHLSKPFFEIWQELRGNKIYEVNTQSKNTYKSISKTETFTPPETNPNILYARLLKNIEEAFVKVRNYHYQVGKLIIFLKTQKFQFHSYEIKLPKKINYPLLIHDLIKKNFNNIYHKNTQYRATGCHLEDLGNDSQSQLNLFSNQTLEDKAAKVYKLYDNKKVDFGTSLFNKEKSKKEKPEKKLKIPLLSLNYR